jgi:transposase
MNARAPPGIGKSDPLDAATIGTAVLDLEESQLPITRWRERQEQIELSIARKEALRLARVLEVTTQLTANQKRMTGLIKQSPAAPLLEMVGAGAVTVATVLAAWSHPGRVRSEAAFASLAGVNPLSASSGTSPEPSTANSTPSTPSRNRPHPKQGAGPYRE